MKICANIRHTSTKIEFSSLEEKMQFCTGHENAVATEKQTNASCNASIWHAIDSTAAPNKLLCK